MKKAWIRIICFILVLGLVLGCVNHILSFKYGDGIYVLDKFYELENDSVDVLILGSSHAYENINTGTLWDEYGMASFVLGGSLQPLWNTYYYMKEALKTQHPKVIVLEPFVACWYEDYIDDVRTIKSTFGLKWSLDKLKAIKASVPKEKWSEFLLEYVQYHTRYTELNEADFLPNQNNRLYDDWKGFACNMQTEAFETPDVSMVTDREPLYEKTESYLRRMLQLAQDEGIPMVIAVSPYPGILEEEQRIYNTVSDIAAEYGVPFVNNNLYVDEIGLDYSVDAADNAHLNHRGNPKYAAYLGKYLKEHYDIPDRREDTSYVSWDRHAAYIRQLTANQELTECEDVDRLPGLLDNKDYWTIVSVKNSVNEAFLKGMGIETNQAAGMWIIRNSEIIHLSDVNSKMYLSSGTHEFLLERKEMTDEKDNFVVHNSVIMDGEDYGSDVEGMDILIYDTKTERIVDCFVIAAGNNQIIRIE